MDIFITIISWIGGFALFGLIGLIFVFSSTAHKHPGESSADILSLASLALILWLLWMGASSIFHMAGSAADTYLNEAQPSSSVSHPAVTGSDKEIVTDTADQSEQKDDLRMQILFILAIIPFLIWIFTPSTRQDTRRDLIRKKVMASIALEKGEYGTRPWNPDWKPEDDHSENDEK